MPNDKVEYGEGHDTVYFDQELELVFPDECEEKNPVRNTLEAQRAATYAAPMPEVSPVSDSKGEYGQRHTARRWWHTAL